MDLERHSGYRFATVGAAAALSALYVALTFALLWRADLRTSSLRHAALSLVAFQIDTFAFHAGLMAAVLGVLLAVGRKWGLTLACVPAVLCTVGPSLLEYWPRHSTAAVEAPVTVMTVNLYGANDQPEALVHEIVAADPDVLLVQEYNERWHEAIFSAVGERYPHVATIPRQDFYGMAVYSKLPFEGSGPRRVELGGLTVPCMKFCVRMGDRPVTFFNVHLVPPKGVEHFQRQNAQFVDLLEAALAGPHPVVLAGDFNFTPRSAFAGRLRELGLRTSHELAGRGRGSTWPVDGLLRYMPGLRIDHLYLGPELTCLSSHTGAGRGSDHRPVVAVVGFVSKDGTNR